MKEDLLQQFKLQFEKLQAEASMICEQAEKAIAKVQEGQFLSEEEASLLSAALESYRTELIGFREAGKEYAIKIEDGITSVRDAIQAIEDQQKLVAERQLVLDYLRLTTKAENVISKLEESKQLLMEQCRRSDVSQALRPFGLVVESVKSNLERLPDAVYDTIEKAIGKPIARATDRGDLSIDDTLDVTTYMDGSCDLLSSVSTTQAGPKESAGTEKLEEATLRTTAVDDPEKLPLWEAFDGYVRDGFPEIPDVPSICFNSDDFSQQGILPECLSDVRKNETELFKLRERLIKQYILQNGSRTEGINLICMDKSESFPYACWGECSGDEPNTSVHYVGAALFSPGEESNEIYELRKTIVSAGSAIITLIVRSQEDAEKLAAVLNLGEHDSNVNYYVLEQMVQDASKESAAPDEKSDQSSTDNTPVKKPRPSDQDTPAAEDGDRFLYPILNKVKTGTPNASTFKRDIDKLARTCPEIRVILPLFTNVGVLTKPDIYAMCACVSSFDGKEETQNGIYAAVDVLTEKGYLAQFQISEESFLYCLSGYSCACLNKESIRQSKGFLELSVGAVKIFANTEIRGEDVFTIYICNTVLRDYLLHQMDVLPPKKLNKIVQSIRWRSDHYQVGLYDDDVLRQAFLCILAEDADNESYGLNGRDIDAEYLIVSKDNIGSATLFNEKCKMVVVVDREQGIYYCNPKDSILDQIDLDGNSEPLSEPAAQLRADGSVSSAIVEKPADFTPPDAVAVFATDSTATHDSVSETPTDTLEEDQNQPVESNPVLVDLQQMLHTNCPTDDQFTQAIHMLLSRQTLDNSESGNYSALADAMMLAKAASFYSFNQQACQLYRKLLAATNIPLDDADYTGENLSSLFSRDSDDEALMLAAFCQAMFSPQKTYDYTLDGVCDKLIEDYDLVFPSFPKCKGLFISLNDIRKTIPEGFSDRVIGLLSDQAERQMHLNRIAEKAKDLLEPPAPNTTGLPGHRETLIECFGPASALGKILKGISEGTLTVRDQAESLYQAYCKENGKISQTKIDAYIEEVWRNNRKHRSNLVSKARAQVDYAFWARLELIKEWLDAGFDSPKVSAKAIKGLRTEILKHIGKELLQLKHVDARKNPSVLYWTLQNLKKRLEATDGLQMIDVFSGILFSGVISMADSGLPVIDSAMREVRYYEPWRNVIRHITAPSLEEAEVREGIIIDNSSPFHDNYRQLRMLGRYGRSDSDDYIVEPEDVKRALAEANAAERQFKQELEFAYTYDRIGEADRERISALLDYRESFFRLEDFGCWKNYLSALRQQIEDIALARRTSLIHRLDAAKAVLAEGETSPLLTAAEKLLTEKQNYAVAEEFLNRFDAGERELSAEANLLRNEERTFEEFISPEVYNPIFTECSKRVSRNGSFRNYGYNYISTRFPAEWTSRYKEDAKAFIENWPIAKKNTTEDNITAFLRLLGLDVISAKKEKSTGNMEHFKATVKNSPRNKADYPHPISAFGTQIHNPVNVLVLYGKNDPSEIVSKVNNMNLGSNTIVIIDYPLALADRRSVAQQFHKATAGHNSFLLIDQVLAVFLAMKIGTERLPAFLKCTLPFTRYQPFVFDGGPTADDMFCGRVSELQKILDPQGACVVYGGRQLGKTALLQRAESLRSKPEDLHFAVYTNIIKISSEQEVVRQIIEDTNKKTGLRIPALNSFVEFVGHVSKLFQNGQVRSLLLLIDEADDFLEHIRPNQYNQIQPLVNLKRETSNAFKFVLAGLHNVYRTKDATDQNGVFGQLGMPLCIKPLSPTDALQLISRPLLYLGFQVDRYPHLETILTNTNYYPGILQFFGYNLVQSVPTQYGEYFSDLNGNPPFTLEEKQLSAIMTSNDLNNSIKEKFRLTLKLDPRYFMLARVIALLYIENDNPETSRDGFIANRILHYAQDLGINCLEGCDLSSITNLLDEMVEMGILNRVDQTRGYCLRRRSFLNIIGTDEDALLDEIISENKEIE